MAGRRHEIRSFPGFPEGVNNVYREDSVPASALRSAQNVDLLNGGKIRRRLGRTRVRALTDPRSLHSHLGSLYCAEGADFLRIDPIDHEAETVYAVHPTRYLDYASLNQYLYVSDGERAFRVGHHDVEAWSVEQPAGQPTLSFLGMGSMPPGVYQVAVTYLRGREESGATLASQIELTAEGSIQLSAIPVPQSDETTAIRVYVTSTSGSVLYWYEDYSAATTSVVVTRPGSGKQLETQFLEPVPAGDLIASYRGRLYSAKGSRLYYSQALRYGLCNLAQDFFEFGAEIDMVQPVENGIFVSAADRVSFLSGTSPEEMSPSIAHHSPAVRGTNTLVPAGAFSFENLKTGYVAVWWSRSGIMVVGMANGQIMPLREGELSLPSYTRGDTIFREQDGVRQLVSVLQQPSTPTSALAAKDEAVVTVHRNGVEI